MLRPYGELHRHFTRGNSMTASTLSGERTVARHSVQVGGRAYTFCLVAPAHLARRTIGEALAGAVAELRAVDTAFSPYRERSLVSALRRSELPTGAYPPPLADIAYRCAAL